MDEKRCGFCGLPCKGYANINGTWYHHGDDEWDDDGSPSCYEKAQWQSVEEDSLLDFIERRSSGR